MEMVQLVKRAASGDPDAFTKLVTHYSGLVFSLCLLRTRDRDEAEDLTQEVFVKVYRRLPTLKEPARFVSWLRRVTANECNAWARARRETASLENIEVDEARETSVTPVTPRRLETETVVAQALRSVSQRNRRALTLHYVSGYSYQEISRLLELPVATVRSRLHEGRRQMKSELLKVVKELCQLRLPPGEMAEQVMARCGSKDCVCAQQLLNP